MLQNNETIFCICQLDKEENVGVKGKKSTLTTK